MSRTLSLVAFAFLAAPETPVFAQDQPAQAVRVGGDVKAPTKIKHVNPIYPSLAKQAGVAGTVVLECTISPQGRVANVKTVSGPSLLQKAAADAAKQWTYEPTVIDGVAVPVIMTVAVNFGAAR